jgi:polo-like kinase 1
LDQAGALSGSCYSNAHSHTTSNGKLSSALDLLPAGSSVEYSKVMTHVKKWVRTRHAILFRMSNRTVQVAFFDGTELGMSCLGKTVSFVDKEGNRDVFSLADIATSGRSDVSKRLKYTKDILYQIISGARR